MQTNWILLCLTLLFLNIELSIGDPKRSFGFGRARPKSNSNLSVRRRGHLSDPPKSPQPTASKQTHTASHSAPPSAPAPAPSAPKINGPPPAYSAGPSSGKTSLNAAPPAYSSHAAPPSYSSATGVNSHANYPRQSYSGVNSGTNMHAPGQGYGWNNHNSYGGNSHGGYAQPPPSYGGMGGYPSAGFGGYGGMPNYGGYGGMMGGGGMMGPGMMGGGMMGGGMMGGVQPLYVQQKSSSSLLPSIAGGALTGLATYQLARALGGSGSRHHSEQHIYHHYDSPQESGQSSVYNQNQPPQSSVTQTHTATTQQEPQGPEHTLQTPHQTIPSTYGGAVQSVPLAPFPPESTTKCTENCPTETNANVTPVPEIDNEFPFATIHPSLFPYASISQSKELEYWAKSVNKKLNLTTPDTDNSSTASP